MMPNEITQENEIAAASRIVKDIDPFGRIDAYIIIGLRERLMAETGCCWESAQRHIWTALGRGDMINRAKRPDRIAPEYGKPPSKMTGAFLLNQLLGTAYSTEENR